MSARSSNRRRRSEPTRTPRRRAYGPRTRRQSRIITECVGWGLFASLVVPAALILTGGSVRTAVIAAAGTAGLTGILYLVARVMRIALPHLDHESALDVGDHQGRPTPPPRPEPEVSPPGPPPPIPRARGRRNDRGVPLSPPYGYEPAPPAGAPYGREPAPPQSNPYGREPAPPESIPYGPGPTDVPSSPAYGQTEPYQDLDGDWDPEWDPFNRPSSGSRRGPRHRAP